MGDDPATAGRGGLRLVWSRPPGLPPLPPRRRVNLAVAIERHLDGRWGVTDEQFALLFATTLADDEEPAARPAVTRVPR